MSQSENKSKFSSYQEALLFYLSAPDCSWFKKLTWDMVFNITEKMQFIQVINLRSMIPS